MAFIKPLRWEHWYNKYCSSGNFIRGVFTNFEILEQFIGLVSMQSTSISKD